jgi:hypothetical protein
MIVRFPLQNKRQISPYSGADITSMQYAYMLVMLRLTNNLFALRNWGQFFVEFHFGNLTSSRVQYSITVWTSRKLRFEV